MSLALVYLALITLAELITAAVQPHVGLALHSLALVALILQGATTRQTQTRRLLLTLALAPLVRILSISLPLQSRPLVDWYMIIGALLYVGAFFTARTVGLGWQRLGLTLKNWPAQLAIAPLGFGLGLIEFYILGRNPLIQTLTWQTFLYPAIVLMIFTGFLEEIIFRGLVQDVSTSVMGRAGIWYSAALFGVLHIGYLSVADVLFVTAVGLLFGFIVQRTRSLLGVSLAHGFTNISMYMIYPFILAGGLATPTLPPQDILTLPNRMVTPQKIVPVIFVTATPIPIRSLTPSSLPPSAEPSATAGLPLDTATPPICGAPAGWVIYIVRQGDTLSALSQAYQVSLGRLQSANCLAISAIYAGQRLFVPNIATATPLPVSDTPTLELPTAAPEISVTPAESPTPEMPASDTPEPSPTDTPLPLPTDTETPPPPAPTEEPAPSATP